MNECASHLKTWNKEIYMGTQNRMGWLLSRLKKVRQMAPTPTVLEEYRNIEQELRQLRQHQEPAAWQRCRPFVLKDGDRNTAYFHAKVSNRRRRNKLKFLEDDNGFKHKDQEGMKTMITSLIF